VDRGASDHAMVVSERDRLERRLRASRHCQSECLIRIIDFEAISLTPSP
jgi:hypothetical protein